MPKRRIRTAAQIRASRENLKKARAARKRTPNKAVAREQAKINALKKQIGFVDSEKPVPVGKNVLLMHRTTPERADAIVSQGFKAGKHRTAAMTESDKQHVFGVVPSTVKNWHGYGKAVVGVKVPRKAVSTDTTMDTYYPAPIKVPLKALKGRKVQRYK